VLIITAALGKRHTILRDPVSLQTIACCSLLPAISRFHGQTTSRFVGNSSILHRLMDSLYGRAYLLVLAAGAGMVSVPISNPRSFISEESSKVSSWLVRQISKPQNLCDPVVPSIVFQVGWTLHFTGSLASR
jgi:hypothetical protein